MKLDFMFQQNSSFLQTFANLIHQNQVFNVGGHFQSMDMLLQKIGFGKNKSKRFAKHTAFPLLTLFLASFFCYGLRAEQSDHQYPKLQRSTVNCAGSSKKPSIKMQEINFRYFFWCVAFANTMSLMLIFHLQGLSSLSQSFGPGFGSSGPNSNCQGGISASTGSSSAFPTASPAAMSFNTHQPSPTGK